MILHPGVVVLAIEVVVDGFNLAEGPRDNTSFRDAKYLGSQSSLEYWNWNEYARPQPFMSAHHAHETDDTSLTKSQEGSRSLRSGVTMTSPASLNMGHVSFLVVPFAVWERGALAVCVCVLCFVLCINSRCLSDDKPAKEAGLGKALDWVG